MEENSYNFISKFLHKISLGSKAVSEMSFEIDYTKKVSQPTVTVNQNYNPFQSLQEWYNYSYLFAMYTHNLE